MIPAIKRGINIAKNSAAMNMAIDEVLLLSQKEEPCPMLRFYGWMPPAFSFGYFQKIREEVDVDSCRIAGIELVRRMTGGGTVVHGWDLTYSLIVPRRPGDMDVSEIYLHIAERLVAAFEKCGIPVQRHVGCPDTDTRNICLANPVRHDVILNHKKVSGVSVRRNRNGMLFQGYISLEMPPPTILAHVSKDPDVQHLICEKSTAINTDGHSMSRSTLIQAICETFQPIFTFRLAKLSTAEYEQAETLARTKYATDTWNF